MSRRKFLKNLGALGVGTVFTPLASQPHSPSSLSPKKNSPVVISTWIHGMEANAGAWEILGASGGALDAVQSHYIAREIFNGYQISFDSMDI